MSVVIKGIEPDSPAQRAGIQAGEILVSLNGHDIIDKVSDSFWITVFMKPMPIWKLSFPMLQVKHVLFP